MKVAVVGGLTIDRNECYGEVYEGVGGSSYYISLALSRLGINVYVYSVVGRDFPQDYIEELCGLSNVSCMLFRYSSPHIIFNNIYSDDGGRIQHVNGIIGRIPVEKVVRQVSSVDYVILSPILNEIYLDDIRSFDVSKLALDLQGFLRRVKDNRVVTGRYIPVEFLNDVDVIKFSLEDAGDIIYNERYFNKVIMSSGRYLCLTMGEKGSLLFTKHESWYIPGYPVKKLKDPTGSGDVFLGGFVYSILSNMIPPESLSFATALTSLFIERADMSMSMVEYRMKFLMDNAINLVGRSYKEFIP